jgi:hypothetical protein
VSIFGHVSQEDREHERLRGELKAARSDFEALLALVRRETISPHGPKKLRFSGANCMQWVK